MSEQLRQFEKSKVENSYFPFFERKGSAIKLCW